MNVICGGRGQEHYGAAEVIGIAPARGRDAIEDGLAADRLVAEGFGIVGAYIAWGNTIDVNAL